MAAEINRMQFLSGDLGGKRLPLRPPWALPESRFTELCTRCGDCLAACEDQLIVEGRGGFPKMDFTRGGCDFCGECEAVCKPAALSREAEEGGRPWRLKATILGNCLSLNAVICRSCGEACDERAIRFQLETGGVARPLLDREACTGCGECFAVCPVRCITLSPDRSQEQAA